MKILIDMNLSPDWVEVLNQAGYATVHWFNIGDPKAPDHEILKWAKENGYVVFTHDLDFGAILAATGADAPSVVQFRSQDITPENSKELALQVLRRYSSELSSGALISIDEARSRVRLLPLRGRKTD